MVGLAFYPTSFPGSLFSASIVVEAKKRDPGNEAGLYHGSQTVVTITDHGVTGRVHTSHHVKSFLRIHS